MKKNEVLNTGLLKEMSKKKISFHSHGQKGKIDMMNEDFFEMDSVSDIDSGAYGLAGKSYLTMSQNKAANLYRSERVFYLANGATSGIYTMLTLCTKAGDKIIVDRNCHKSVINAIVLLGLIPVFITGTYISKYDFCAGITSDDVIEAINHHSDAAAVFITSPSYYGVVSDVKSIANVCHENNMYLLVDEALGGHFSFSQRLPASATRLGADMVVQSISKTLGAISGTGILHVNTNDFMSEKIKETINMYQTSSPSYALYAHTEKTIDAAFKFADKYKAIVKTIEKYAAYVNKYSNAYWIDSKINDIVFDKDTTKVVINFSNTSLSGYDVAKALYEKYAIETEIASFLNITASVSVYNKISDIKKLAEAVVAIVGRSVKSEAEFKTRNPVHNLKIIPRDAFFAEGENVPISESLGRISKNIVGRYLSGAPILVPGEEITELHIRAICDCEGEYVEGIREDLSIEVVKKS